MGSLVELVSRAGHVGSFARLSAWSFGWILRELRSMTHTRGRTLLPFLGLCWALVISGSAAVGLIGRLSMSRVRAACECLTGSDQGLPKAVVGGNNRRLVCIISWSVHREVYRDAAVVIRLMVTHFCR